VNTTRGVDSHAHVFSADAPPVPGARYRPDYPAEPRAWRALWAAAGITHGVIVQPSFFGGDNREMLDTLASDREHLRGVAVLHPNMDDATLQRFHAHGVRAVRLNLRGVRDYTEYWSESWRAFYCRLHEAGWHVECFVDTGRLPDIAPAFDGCPVAVVFDHFGSPGNAANIVRATFDAARKLKAERDVWCKFSGPYRLEGGDAKDHAARWLDAIGPSRVVWGSDWPFTGFETTGEYAALRARLSEWVAREHEPAVLWDNAARLYGFE
jgi:predicted TIM-barrel fold metal-dependent hydrolase